MNFDLILNNKLALTSSSQHFCFESDGKKITFYGERLFSEHRENLGNKEHASVYYLSDKFKYLWIQGEKYNLCSTLLEALEIIKPKQKTIYQIFHDLNIPLGYYLNGVNHKNVKHRDVKQYEMNYTYPIFTTHISKLKIEEKESANFVDLVNKQVQIIKGHHQFYILVNRYKADTTPEISSELLKDEVHSVNSWESFLKLNQDRKLITSGLNLKAIQQFFQNS